MIGVLFKKQLAQTFAFVYYDRNKSKARTPLGIAGFSALYLTLFGYLGVSVGLMANTLCEPFFAVGYGWLYMAIMSLLATLLGVMGSVFSTYVSLYKPKDNDLLLSMPIPTHYVVLSRLMGVYLLGLMYVLLVMLPAILVMVIKVQVGFLGVLFSLVLPFLLSFAVLALSCVLGYLVALLAAHFRYTKVLTMVLSVGFLCGYFFLSTKAYEAIGDILKDPSSLGEGVKTALYPFYRMGLASTGDGLSMLMVTALALGLACLVFYLINRNFLRLATANRGHVKAKYVQKKVARKSIGMALLGKELKRFTSSTVYMLNSGLGILMMLIAGGALLVKSESIDLLFGALVPDVGVRALIVAGLVGFTSSMNMITAPSVSMEGRHVWLTKSLPVPTHSVLYAKLWLQIVLTAPSTAFLTLCAVIVARLPWQYALLAGVSAAVLSLFFAIGGLVLGLLFPTMEWVDETVPVKQGMAVFLTLFGSWGVVVGLGGIFWLCRKWIGAVWYLALVTALLSVASVLLLRWLRRGGARRFEAL